MTGPQPQISCLEAWFLQAHPYHIEGSLHSWLTTSIRDCKVSGVLWSVLMHITILISCMWQY